MDRGRVEDPLAAMVSDEVTLRITTEANVPKKDAAKADAAKK